MIRYLLALLLALSAGAARADELRPGYLDLTEIAPQSWRMTWKGPLRSGLARYAHPALPENCEAPAPRRQLDDVALTSVWTMTCTAPLSGKEIRIKGLEGLIADVLVRVAPIDCAVKRARLTPDMQAF